MTGKRYYLTTLGAWHRHAARFVNSHWLALGEAAPTVAPGEVAADDTTPILALVEADEGAHLALEDDVAFEALPHPLAQKPISETCLLYTSFRVTFLREITCLLKHLRRCR